MKIIDREIELQSRSDRVSIYPFGDVHIGARNCAETPLRRVIKEVQFDPNAYWFGGGDLIDAVIPSDVKRFDFNTLPDWMLQGSPNVTRANLGDILEAQVSRGGANCTPPTILLASPIWSFLSSFLPSEAVCH